MMMNKLLLVIWVLVVWLLSAMSYEILTTVFMLEESYGLRVMLVVAFAIVTYELSEMFFGEL